MAKLFILPIKPEHIINLWPQVLPYLERAVKYDTPNPDYTIEHMQRWLVSGRWELLIGVDELGETHGIATLSYIDYPLHKIAFITCISGRMVTTKSSWDALVDYATEQGATKIQAHCRPSMLRLGRRLGFEHITSLMEIVI